MWSYYSAFVSYSWPDPANSDHHVHAAFLPAEEGAQVMANFAFGYATLRGPQSNTKEVFIQTG